MARETGFEPATSAVTGRRANQLRYGALALPLGSHRGSVGTLTHGLQHTQFVVAHPRPGALTSLLAPRRRPAPGGLRAGWGRVKDS